jgi:lipid-A-disaccharide synthase
MTRDEFAARHGFDPERLIVALLPGSRRNEIAQNYPRIVEACELLAREMKASGDLQFAHAAAPGLGADLFAPSGRRPGVEIKRIEGSAYDTLAAADCAIVASGTATIEAALLGTPMVVVYRVAPVTATILRRMVKTPFISMVNLVAGRRLVPELIQDGFTPAAVAAEVRYLLESSDGRDEMKAGLAEVRARLGSGGAIERAADVFARML